VRLRCRGQAISDAGTRSGTRTSFSSGQLIAPPAPAGARLGFSIDSVSLAAPAVVPPPV